ncbi:MAG: hypothetical protein NZ849_11320 [Meiothermus sp.]|uniref:hypothetical protein n=1 Tax=Meiothermus sp. TaxID=1955249 RepID=UPI0025FF6F06|nr:hypothetical protein [Meiothermus sp.]MCS7059148.1 hypothetical protein [Meiothermus sp.]MCS7195480.1 hypothetical protein [Meiothermus sp.]MCX7741209.1 hypothetical protein [Meiothermus sp.]MDW8090408.1 hypothetical protein [Meiothermus sp.]MDW8481090.1 hypothetical protein [Meiothermus sp.]
MIARYVLTSACLHSGTMNLIQPLRVYLRGKEQVLLRDEEGETYEGRINWQQGRLEGLAAYYAKRRLGVNDRIALHLEGEMILLEALTPSAKPPRPRLPEERPKPQPDPVPEKRVRVTPYPKEVIFPYQPLPLEVPAFSADLEALGFVRESAGAPWVFRASLGRRTFHLALAKFGEIPSRELLAYRQQGRVQYAAIVAGESVKEEALAEIASVRPSGLAQVGLGYVSPEALQRLVRLRSRFPVGPLDVERLLREGRVDFEAVQRLEGDIFGVLHERGHFSAVLTLLADYPPQQVFLLADLMPAAREMGLEADHLQGILETLSSPPFLLLKRLSPGEFLMRQSVEQALSDWVEYAQAMQRRLQGVLRE